MRLFQAGKAFWRAKTVPHPVALAKGEGGFKQSAEGVWAYYRLGMYARVISLPAYTHSVNAQIARIASLAACGEGQQAEQQGRALLKSGKLGSRSLEFIQAVAAFSPSLAEKLCNLATPPATSVLPAALALRLGKIEEAKACYSTYVQEITTPPPDMTLIKSTLYAQSPAEQLSDINDFLNQHGLSSVAALVPDAPIGVTNLTAIPQSATTSGQDAPLVSVLMTTYCSGDRAVRAIQSLLAQEHQNLEIIVVDDASPDNTFEQIQTCAAQDARVKCFKLPLNAGTYVAKTYGYQRSNGDFITCHDSDDWSHPEKISRQLAPLLNDPKVMVTTSQWVRLCDNGDFYVRQAYPFTRLNPSSPLVRREVIERVGSWDLVRTGADSEFLARIKLYYGRKALVRLSEPLAFGAHRDDSLMTAKNTGHTENAVSPTRLAYWEAWSDWHLEQLRDDKPLCLRPLNSANRAFEAPAAIKVPAADIEVLLSEIA